MAFRSDKETQNDLAQGYLREEHIKVLSAAEQYISTLGQATGGTGYVAPEVQSKLKEHMHGIRAVREVVAAHVARHDVVRAQREKVFVPSEVSRESVEASRNKQRLALMANRSPVSCDAQGFILWTEHCLYRIRDVVRSLRVLYPDRKCTYLDKNDEIREFVSEGVGRGAWVRVSAGDQLVFELRQVGLRTSQESDYKAKRARQMEIQADKPDV